MARRKKVSILTDETIGWLTLAATALGGQQRLHIFRVLLEAGRPLTVNELTDLMSALVESTISQPTISYHLTRLEECGLITKEKVGVFVTVAIDPERFRELAALFVRIADAAPAPSGTVNKR